MNSTEYKTSVIQKLYSRTEPVSSVKIGLSKGELNLLN